MKNPFDFYIAGVYLQSCRELTRLYESEGSIFVINRTSRVVYESPSPDSMLPSGLKHRKISATVGGSSENTCNHAGTDRTDLTPHYVRANTVQWTSGEFGPLAIDGRRSSVKAWLAAEQFKDLSTGGCPYLSLDHCTLNKEVT